MHTLRCLNNPVVGPCFFSLYNTQLTIYNNKRMKQKAHFLLIVIPGALLYLRRGWAKHFSAGYGCTSFILCIVPVAFDFHCISINTVVSGSGSFLYLYDRFEQLVTIDNVCFSALCRESRYFTKSGITTILARRRSVIGWRL